MRAWEIVSDGGPEALAMNERTTPVPGPGQVLVSVGASSVNYRDLSTVEEPVARNIAFPMSPNSDCAGAVTAVGTGVDGLGIGDRVMSCFFQDWADGPISPAAMASALGGAIPGVLAEHVVLNADGLVPTPDYLSDTEAATLPCAALTAWHALTRADPVQPGETVLLLGTGGVSVFAQQFCAAMGVNTIVTSSSDDKLARIKDLGAGAVINYRTTPDWAAAVVDATDGVGVDRVVEVGGPGTLQNSIAAVRVGGAIQLIGVLTGAGGEIVPTDIMRKSLSVRGIYVGSRAMFLDMTAFMAAHQIRPVIDEEFAFEDAREAFHRMRSAKHFGKLVIRVGSDNAEPEISSNT